MKGVGGEKGEVRIKTGHFSAKKCPKTFDQDYSPHFLTYRSPLSILSVFLEISLQPFSQGIDGGCPLAMNFSVREIFMCLFVCLFVFQRLMCRYRYKHVVTFGGWKEDFMLVVNQSIMRGGNTVEQGTQRLLFVMSRGKVTCQIKRVILLTVYIK